MPLPKGGIRDLCISIPSNVLKSPFAKRGRRSWPPRILPDCGEPHNFFGEKTRLKAESPACFRFVFTAGFSQCATNGEFLQIFSRFSSNSLLSLRFRCLHIKRFSPSVGSRVALSSHCLCCDTQFLKVKVATGRVMGG